jgi:hypothetical protein
MELRRSLRPQRWDGEQELYRLCRRLAGEEPLPEVRARHLLGYLEQFPLGRHNRQVAEEIELLLDEMSDPPTRTHLHQCFRGLRDAVMEPARPGTWAGPPLTDGILRSLV